MINLIISDIQKIKIEFLTKFLPIFYNLHLWVIKRIN